MDFEDSNDRTDPTPEADVAVVPDVHLSEQYIEARGIERAEIAYRLSLEENGDPISNLFWSKKARHYLRNKVNREISSPEDLHRLAVLSHRIFYAHHSLGHRNLARKWLRKHRTEWQDFVQYSDRGEPFYNSLRHLEREYAQRAKTIKGVPYQEEYLDLRIATTDVLCRHPQFGYSDNLERMVNLLGWKRATTQEDPVVNVQIAGRQIAYLERLIRFWEAPRIIDGSRNVQKYRLWAGHILVDVGIAVDSVEILEKAVTYFVKAGEKDATTLRNTKDLSVQVEYLKIMKSVEASLPS